MTNPLLKTFTEHAYSRADFAQSISLVREFFEFIFFTKRNASASKDGIEQFAAYSKKPLADIAFLRALPSSFLDAFTQESLYETLNRLSEDSKQLKTLSLTVPIVLSRADVVAIGIWAHQEVDPDLLLDVAVNPSIAAGCRLVWNNRLYDFSLDRYLTENQAALHERFAQAQEITMASPHS